MHAGDIEAPEAPLAQFLHGTFHQDMDLEADTVPEAVAAFARREGPGTHEDLKRAMAEFERRHHNRLDDAFHAAFSPDFSPLEGGRNVAAFFAMVRDILEDPDRAAAYDGGAPAGGA